MNFWKLASAVIYFVLSLSLTACGGGGGGDASVSQPATVPSMVNVTYSKGPVTGATAILVDGAGNTVAGPVATINGRASFTSVSYSGSVYAIFSGGTYIDEATGTTVTLASTFKIRSGVVTTTSGSILQLTATPLTEIAFQRAEIAGGGTARLSDVSTYMSDVADEYGLDGIDLTTVSPTPLNSITGISDANQYGAVLAAITQQEVNAGITTPTSITLDNYISSSATSIDTAAFTAAVSGLLSNGNTSNFINNSVVTSITGNVGMTAASSYKVGGNVNNLIGNLELLNNGGDALQFSADGVFTFPNSVANGSAYLVTVSSSPAGQTCSVVNGSGTISGSDVMNVSVNCTSIPTETYTVGGTVSGLIGNLELLNNSGDTLPISTDGVFTFTSSVANGNAYQVSVSSQPSGQNCVVSNASGVISGANIANVNITCLSKTNNNYFLQSYKVTTQEPSIVSVGFRVIGSNGAPLNQTFTANDFEVYEDGALINANEAFLDVEQVNVNSVSKNLKVVYMLDISTSLTDADLDTVIDAVRNSIADFSGLTPVSKLQPGQSVAIYVFDSAVTQVIDFTSDINQLLSAVSGIKNQQRGNSTNLIGAVETGVQAWADGIGLDQFEYGYLIVMTDGRHTSDSRTVSDIEYLLREQVTVAGKTYINRLKEVYTVAIGNADVAMLAGLTGSTGNVFTINNISLLESTFGSIEQKALASLDGLHYLYYASPKRSGSYNFSVSIKNSGLCTLLKLGASPCQTNITGFFDATGFHDVFRTLVVTADNPAPEPGDVVTLTVRRLWTPASFGPPVFQWSIGSANTGSATYTQISDDKVEITFGMDDVSQLDFLVSESQTGLSKSWELTAAIGGMAVEVSSKSKKSFEDEVMFTHFTSSGNGYRDSQLNSSRIISLPYTLPSDLSLIFTRSNSNPGNFLFKGYTGLREIAGNIGDEFTYEIIKDEGLHVEGNVQNGQYDLVLNPALDFAYWTVTQRDTVVRTTNVTRGISKDTTVKWIQLPQDIYFLRGQRDTGQTNMSTVTSSSATGVDYIFTDPDTRESTVFEHWVFRISQVVKVSGGSECVYYKTKNAEFSSTPGKIYFGPFSYAQRCIWDFYISSNSNSAIPGEIKVRHRLTVDVTSSTF